MYDKLDIYSDILLMYKQFINDNCVYNPIVRKKTPQSLTTFPTIILKETSNINNIMTTNRQEFIDSISYTVEIYSKDKFDNNLLIPSDTIVRNIQNLTFEFFKDLGFTREMCDDAEYTDITVDRKIMIFSCKLCNWNRKII